MAAMAAFGPDEIRLRTVDPEQDREFLFSVFAAARPQQLEFVDDPGGGLQDRFLRMQFDAQTTHYASLYPRADDSVIVAEGERAGRLLVDRRADVLLVLDLALLARFRGAGVGATVMGRLFEEANRKGSVVRCHVAHENPSRGFWDRMGMTALGSDGAYTLMERECATSPR